MITVGVIQECLKECSASTYYQKVGAVIFSGKRILGSGHNGIRSTSAIHDKYKNYINSLHAEQDALRNLNWAKLKGSSILVLRISKTLNILSNAKPCPMCEKLLQHIGIKNIFYSDKNGQIVKLKN